MTSPFEISIDGFTGPLDLLWSLVESKQMQVSKIKVAQLVKIYGVYLSKNGNISADVIAEFFFRAASLLLQKVLALLPQNEAQNLDDFGDIDEQHEISEEELLARMSRFRPYRTATAWLLDKKARQDRKFRRIAEQNADDAPIYELGDLYSLCKLWWELLAEFAKKREVELEDFDDVEEEWSGVPGALPDEARIQNRIEEICERLKTCPALSLSALLAVRSVSVLVVTLLALLEMCRMKKCAILQEELFGEVTVTATFGDGVAD